MISSPLFKERLDWRLAQEVNTQSWRRLNGDGTSKVLAVNHKCWRQVVRRVVSEKRSAVTHTRAQIFLTIPPPIPHCSYKLNVEGHQHDGLRGDAVRGLLRLGDGAD